MDKIHIGKLVTEYNYRQDYTTDTQDLKQSIRQNGILVPVKVKKGDDKFVLIDGHLRVKLARDIIKEEAAKDNPDMKIIDKLQHIEYSVSEKTDKENRELQFQLNIQRKNTSPLEEAEGFKKYLDEYNAKPEELANKISKPLHYIQKRLQLLDLPEDIKKALNKNKIQLGHAVALANITSEKEQKQMFEDITENNLTVSDTKEYLAKGTANLKEASFSLESCQTCQYNMGKQATLVSEGINLSNTCNNKKCYIKKNREVAKKVEDELKGQGFNVISEDDYDKIDHKIKLGDNELKKLGDKFNQKCTECEKLAIMVKLIPGGYGKIAVCQNPKCYENKKPGKVTQKAVITEENKEQSAQEKARNQYARLLNNVKEYMHKWFVPRTRKATKINTQQQKALTAYTLFNEENDIPEKMLEFIKPGTKTKHDIMIDEILDLFLGFDDAKLDKIIHYFALLKIKQLNLDELKLFSRKAGVDFSKEFVIDEEFLKMHTSDQLSDLASELKNPNFKKGKKDDMIKTFTDTGFDLRKSPKICETVLSTEA